MKRFSSMLKMKHMVKKHPSSKLAHYRQVFAHAVKHAKGKKGEAFKQAVKNYIKKHHKKV